MGMKNLMCEILVDKQKEYIKSLESQIKNKNETILKETQRANEMFQLSYNRKLKIEEQQAEINRLKEALKKIILYAPGCYNTAECPLNVGGGFDSMCGYKCAFVIAHKALNGESEGKC